MPRPPGGSPSAGRRTRSPAADLLAVDLDDRIGLGRTGSVGVRWRGRRPRSTVDVGVVFVGFGVVEPAPDELDEDVLERRLRLAEGEDVGAKAAERADD